MGILSTTKGHHAQCADCLAILHVPYMEATSIELLAIAWGSRLREGCADCGGELRSVFVGECADCAAVWPRRVA